MKRIFFILSLTLIMTNIAKAQETQAQQSIVEITTSYGTIKILLYDNTPLHRDNFLKLVKEGYYDGTLFHRVINNFMIQGGDPDSKNAKPGRMLGQGGPGYTIPAEFNSENYHKKGALAAARAGDDVNPSKSSSGSQFYIVQGRPFSDLELNQMELRSGVKLTTEQREVYKTTGGTPHLDGSYTVFGEVVEGLDVIDTIAKLKTGNADRPVTDIVMTIKIAQ
jgi:cyclophilin family peptidyl-prolyl cis-trans isomerase